MSGWDLRSSQLSDALDGLDLQADELEVKEAAALLTSLMKKPELPKL